MSASIALHEHARASLDVDEKASLDESLAAARDALGDEGFAQAWAEGAAMTWEEAISLAKEVRKEPDS